MTWKSGASESGGYGDSVVTQSALVWQISIAAGNIVSPTEFLLLADLYRTVEWKRFAFCTDNGPNRSNHLSQIFTTNLAK